MWFEKRLTPETPSTQGRIGQVVIAVSVADDQAAVSLLDTLQNDDGAAMRRLLSERIPEFGHDEEDTEFQPSTTGEESDTSSESSVGSSASLQLGTTRMEITFGAVTGTGIDAEAGEDVLPISRRAYGDGWTSGSDEDIAPPRRRRRYE
ncbi:hypothetical protein PMIN04_002886 [Paraphaeosphaeria minitans]